MYISALWINSVLTGYLCTVKRFQPMPLFVCTNELGSFFGKNVLIFKEIIFLDFLKGNKVFIRIYIAFPELLGMSYLKRMNKEFI